MWDTADKTRCFSSSVSVIVGEIALSPGLSVSGSVTGRFSVDGLIRTSAVFSFYSGTALLSCVADWFSCGGSSSAPGAVSAADAFSDLLQMLADVSEAAVTWPLAPHPARTTTSVNAIALGM